jgi:TolA-binding protein
MQRSIFISYRREDAVAHSGRLADRLSAHFGKSAVFIDVDGIPPGDDFVDVLTSKVAACDTLIAVIGKNWLQVTDEHGRRRLDDPDDLVVVEIRAALERKIRVIPVLVGGAAMPRALELPDTIRSLARRNAFHVSDTNFHSSADQLIETLERHRPKELIGSDRATSEEPPGQPASELSLDSARTPGVRDLTTSEDQPRQSVEPTAPVADSSIPEATDAALAVSPSNETHVTATGSALRSAALRTIEEVDTDARPRSFEPSSTIDRLEERGIPQSNDRDTWGRRLTIGFAIVGISILGLLYVLFGNFAGGNHAAKRTELEPPPVVTASTSTGPTANLTTTPRQETPSPTTSVQARPQAPSTAKSAQEPPPPTAASPVRDGGTPSPAAVSESRSNSTALAPTGTPEERGTSAAARLGFIRAPANTQPTVEEAAAAPERATGPSSPTGNSVTYESLYNEAVVLFNQGKFADARIKLAASTKAYPLGADAFYLLGMTLLNLGQTSDSVKVLENFLELAPNHHRADEVRAVLPALREIPSSKTMRLPSVPPGYGNVPTGKGRRYPALPHGQWVDVTARDGRLYFSDPALTPVSCSGLSVSSSGARVTDESEFPIENVDKVTVKSSSGSVTFYSGKMDTDARNRLRAELEKLCQK